MWSLMVEWRGRCFNRILHAAENYFHRHTAKGEPKKLEEPELDLLQLLKKSRPSVTYMAKLDTSR